MTGVTPTGPGQSGQAPEHASRLGHAATVPNADLLSLSAWPERRPSRTESERAEIAERFASHLPKPEVIHITGERDINAMRAAFIRRFDEQLPRTETLFAVAAIGYRMALRDAQKGPS